MNFFGESMKLGARWTWWRERRRFHPPDEIHRAGELAEQRLAKISRAAGKANGWHVFESVRIPDAEQGGKREIDLVIVGGNTLLVVEQKHWSGSFEINAEEEFIQHRKNGTTHNHSTVNQRITRKARMLVAMHNERVGKDDDVDVRVVLAFTNRNLDWPTNVMDLGSIVKDEAGFIGLLEEEDPAQVERRFARNARWIRHLGRGGTERRADVQRRCVGPRVGRFGGVVAGWTASAADRNGGSSRGMACVSFIETE